MDAKARLIQKIKERDREIETAAATRNSALNSFNKDLAELHNMLRSLVEDLPSVKIESLASIVDGETFKDGSLSIELYGNVMTFDVAKEAGKFGLNVTNIWSRRTFLTPLRLHQWAGSTNSESFVLTDDLILEKLEGFVESPVAKRINLWD
jgi:hypothetical protein